MSQHLKGFKDYFKQIPAGKQEKKKNIFTSSSATSKAGPFGKDDKGKYFCRIIDSDNEETLPKFLIELMNYLQQKHSKVQGLFRREGVKNLVNEAIEVLDDPEDDEDLELSEILEAVEGDPHSIAQIIITYFRMMGEPLFKYYLFKEWIGCITENEVEMKRRIVGVVSKLDVATRVLMRCLFHFLNHIGRHSKINQLNPENLSILFSPSLLRPKGLTADNVKKFKEASQVHRLVQFFIEHPDGIFKD